MGTGPNPRQVVQLIEDWRPEKAYRSETKFQNDLQDWLDAQLNSGGGGLLGGGGGEAVVTREHGQVNADVCVDGEIGIEMKRDFTNSKKDRLRGQIEKYREHYPYVIVVACGISDMDGWRELKNKYGGQGMGMGMGMEQKGEVHFIHKRKENFGKARDSGQGGGGLFGGDSLF